MRIAVYTKTWRNSGTGLFVKELVGGLLNRECKVEYIAPELEQEITFPSLSLIRRKTGRERLNGGKLVRGLSSLKRCLENAVYVMRARATADAILISSPDPWPFFLCTLVVLRLLGAKVIYVVHDPVPHKWATSKRFRWLEVAVLNLTYTLSTNLVVLSESSKDTLLKCFPKLKSVKVIAHGVFPPIIDEPVHATFNLLIFGTIRENKGIKQAIEATLRARKEGLAVTLTVAGEPHAADRAYFEDCLSLAQRDPRGIVVSGGYVSDAELRAHLVKCDALLMPYTAFHSQSGVAILAACNARPLISSGAGGLSDLIAMGMPVQFIEDASSVESIQRAIQAFYSGDVMRWSEPSRMFKSKILQEFSWSEIANQYINIVRSYHLHV